VPRLHAGSGTPSPPPIISAEAQAARDQAAVEAELVRYDQEAVPLSNEVERGVDLLRFWEVRTYPDVTLLEHLIITTLPNY
jgi:hypothetical protein